MPIKPAKKPKNIPCTCVLSSMVSLYLMAPDFLRQSSAMHIRIRPNFPGLGRGLFRAISSGFWLKKFFSSDFLRQLAQKVFFARFPQAIGPKSFFRAISSGFRLKKFFSSDCLRLSAEKLQAISSGNHQQCTSASGQISSASAADFRCSRRG